MLMDEVRNLKSSVGEINQRNTYRDAYREALKNLREEFKKGDIS